jgi:hypothetical protein
MEESNKTICKRCQVLKDRILVGKYPNGRDKKFKDESGKLWSGKICGECQVARAREAMRVRRAKVEVKADEAK